ncbi:MAG TPA: response regulator transcription factor [Cytophagaceae bacterium]|jgi:two-component system alkaline phosphatase synthesis response regulator PhoP|nr:response regulator transcription factor [Cytophagaceae bacterium]
MSKKYKVLVVDDEPDIQEMLQYNLEKEGYEVKTAGDGKEAVETARKFLPHLILMDIMMPKMDGIEACRQVRQINKLKDVFIIFLTSRSEEYSEIAAFDGGANDYITKPIKPRALMSRVSAIFRRDAIETKDEMVTLGDLSIDKTSYTVLLKGKKIILPKKEFELLYFLASNPNVVYGREQLLRNIWGSDVYVVPRTVDVHIRKVREKLGDAVIKTVKGIGYKIEV